MRILLCHPGATFSVSDVHDGLARALHRREDVQVIHFALDSRIDVYARALNSAYSRYGKANGLTKPTDLDAVYFACQGIIERALRLQPDWVVLVTGHFFPAEFVCLLRRARFKVAYLLTESPYEDVKEVQLLENADLAWTNERSSARALAEAAAALGYPARVRYLPHAFDPFVHRPGLEVPEGTPHHDVVFVGTGFIERIKLLEAVDWSGIDFGLYGAWTMMGSRSRLRRHLVEGPTANSRAVELYRAAKIGLNLYRTSVRYERETVHVTWGESLSPRALELAACGLFQISEYRPEVEEVFGETVPTFAGPVELERQIRRWLAATELQRSAQACAARGCVEGRGFDGMAAQVLADLAAII